MQNNNTNLEFIKELHRNRPAGSFPYVTQFGTPPDALVDGKPNRGIWAGYGLDKVEFIPTKENCNNFVVVSAFFPDSDGKVRRKKTQFASLGAIMIDDIGTGQGAKIKPEDIPMAPTVSIETSHGNFQYWYFLEKPITDREAAERLIESFIAKGLTSDGADPGMSAVTRYARLPLGINNKQKYPRPFQQIVERCDYSIRFTPEELIDGFEIELVPQRVAKVYAEATDEQKSAASTVLESIKAIGLYQEEIDDGVHAINCPWGSDHTGGDLSGTAYFEPSGENNYLGGYKCHHGHCQNKTLGHFLDYVENRIGKKFNLDGKNNTAAEDFAVVPTSSSEPGAVSNNFQYDNRGRIEPTQANLLILLDQYKLRYDEFRAAYMGYFGGEIRVLEEADYTRIQFVAEQMGFKKMSKDMIRDNILMVCMNNKFDSAIEWGNSLKWDGVERCQDLLTRYFGAKETNYTNAASMYIASAMGGRLMEPGCKADAAIVLVGAQGAGKTVSINALAPLDDSFAEISLHNRDADLSRVLRGKLIGELAELRGLKSKDAEDIKAWMSRTTEEWTPKYQEFTKTFKRRLTFWGSTNDTQFLNDVTGNRRWLPVTVGTPDPDAIKQDCEQIWAEAIDIYKNNGVLWQTVQSLADEVREEHFDEDPFVEEVRKFFNFKSAINKFTSREIWAGTSFAHDTFDQKASKQVKRAIEVIGGWKHGKVTIDGEQSKGYIRCST